LSDINAATAPIYGQQSANTHPLGSPHDAMYPLQQLVHWMADDDVNQ
jgi:hypothetical protein